MKNQSVVERVILPLYAQGDENQLVLAATVLASWLDAPLQLIAPDEASAAQCRSLAGTLGLPTEPVVCISSTSFIEGLIEHLQSTGPSVCVTTVSRGGLELALRSGQAAFLVAASRRTRLPSGPIGVELTGGSSDVDALVTAAAWATKLECGVRLVVDHESVPADLVGEAERRLAELGIDAGVDTLRAGSVPPLVLLGRTRDSTAIVIPQDRATESDLITAADTNGVSVLVAGAMADEPDRASRPHDPGVTESGEASGAVVPGFEIMNYEECLVALDGCSVARVAYVDHGWPTVVPVNYTARSGEIFIRSHAGGKLNAARRNDVVCLEVDVVDESTRTGWSVVGHGHLEVISDPATLRTAWANDPSPWAESPEWHWLRLVPFSLTGRRVPT